MAITYVGAGALASQSTPGSALSVPYPSGIQAGDLLVIQVTNNTASQWATNAFAGFTRRNTGTSGGSSPTGAVFYKIATGSESGSISGTNPGGTAQGRMLAYRGVDQTTPFDVADALFGSSTSVTAYDIPSQTTSMVGATLVMHAWANSATGSFTPPTVPVSATELTDSVIASHPHFWQGHVVAWSGSGATGVRNLVRSGGIRGGAIGVALRPAGAGSIVTGTSSGTQAGVSSATGIRHVQGTSTSTQAGASSAGAIRTVLGTASAAEAGVSSAAGVRVVTATSLGAQAGSAASVALRIVLGTSSGTQEGTSAAVATDPRFERVPLPSPGPRVPVDAPEARVPVDPPEGRVPVP